MPEEQAQTPEAAETEQGEEKQAVTAEQLAELQKRLEAITAAQAGSDRKVQELTKALAAAREEKESTAKSAEERIAELELRAREADKKAQHATLRTKARDMLEKEGIKAPRYLDRLIGDTDEETEKLVSDFIEDEKEREAERNKAHDREHGRTVVGGKRGAPGSYGQLLEMTEEQLKSFSPEEIARISRAAVESG